MSDNKPKRFRRRYDHGEYLHDRHMVLESMVDNDGRHTHYRTIGFFLVADDAMRVCRLLNEEDRK